MIVSETRSSSDSSPAPAAAIPSAPAKLLVPLASRCGRSTRPTGLDHVGERASVALHEQHVRAAAQRVASRPVRRAPVRTPPGRTTRTRPSSTATAEAIGSCATYASTPRDPSDGTSAFGRGAPASVACHGCRTWTAASISSSRAPGTRLAIRSSRRSPPGGRGRGVPGAGDGFGIAPGADRAPGTDRRDRHPHAARGHRRAGPRCGRDDRRARHERSAAPPRTRWHGFAGPLRGPLVARVDGAAGPARAPRTAGGRRGGSRRRRGRQGRGRAAAARDPGQCSGRGDGPLRALMRRAASGIPRPSTCPWRPDPGDGADPVRGPEPLRPARARASPAASTRRSRSAGASAGPPSPVRRVSFDHADFQLLHGHPRGLGRPQRRRDPLERELRVGRRG